MCCELPVLVRHLEPLRTSAPRPRLVGIVLDHMGWFPGAYGGTDLHNRGRRLSIGYPPRLCKLNNQ